MGKNGQNYRNTHLIEKLYGAAMSSSGTSLTLGVSVLSERLELSYFTLGLRIPYRIPSRYLVRT